MTEQAAILETTPAVRPIRVGLLGLGTVGQGLCRLLTPAHEKRHGVVFRITHALVRDSKRENRWGFTLVDEVDEMLRQDFDLVVEAMGGVEPAGTIVSRFLERGVPVVTANKALLAEKGPELVALASRNGTALRFEASVAAGIPILGLLDRALHSLTVSAVHAVLNGTSNYILTRITEERAPFEHALEEAQRLGYAEADPSLDIHGMDAAQKLAVLVRSLGSSLAVDQIRVQGLEGIDPSDCTSASRHGYTLKPVAAARLEGSVQAFVAPALVRNEHPLAGVSGVENGVVLFGKPLGRLFLSGPGAGALPTAASMLDDMIHAATDSNGTVARWKTNGPPAPESGDSWFISMTPRNEGGDIDDLLDFVGSCGITFRELRENGAVTGITTRVGEKRIQGLEATLHRSGALQRFRAYRVLGGER